MESSPTLPGNTWWKSDLTNTQLKEDFIRAARRQVDYALGANPYGRSYLVGFGNKPFKSLHHRRAHGAWAAFNYLIPDRPEYQKTSRHISYGALIAGPDHNDVFLTGKGSHPYLAIPGTS